MGERIASGEQLGNNQPDLAAVYGGKEVTAFGMTAPIDVLEAMCPVDLSDPKYAAAKNDFVIKIMNESGAEIAPEHEELFSQRLEALGIERTFTVESLTKIQQQERTTIEPKKEIHEAGPKPDVVVAETTQDVPKQREFALSAADETRIQQEAQRQAEEAIVAETRHDPVETETSLAPLPSSSDTIRGTVDVVEAAYDDAIDVATVIEAEPISQSVEQPLRMDEHAAEPDDANEPAALELPIAEQSIQYETSTESTTELLQDILQKDPAELYEDFTDALKHYIEPTQSESVTEPVPEIAKTVAERLDTLTQAEKQSVAEAVQDVVGALHGLLMLEERGADAATIAATEAQLTDLCVALLESIEIEYSEQDIHDFVLLLRQPKFQIALAAHSNLVSEELGTHESKYFPRIATSSQKDYLHHSLGIFTLLCSGLHGGSKSALSVKKFVTSGTTRGLQFSN